MTTEIHVQPDYADIAKRISEVLGNDQLSAELEPFKGIVEQYKQTNKNASPDDIAAALAYIAKSDVPLRADSPATRRSEKERGESLKPPPQPNYANIAKRLKNGNVVPFFGSGASVVAGLPSADKLVDCLIEGLVEGLSEAYERPTNIHEFVRTNMRVERKEDLAFVASYLQLKDYHELRSRVRRALLEPDPAPVPVQIHKVLCGLELEKVKIYLTTNYDDLIEEALKPRKPWVVVQRADQNNAEKVWCRPQGGDWEEFDSNSFGTKEKQEIKEGPIVLKLHGTLDRGTDQNDSFLITQEQYVNFLAREQSQQVPPTLFTMMREKSFLFLGYSLKDWNVRVLLQQFAKAAAGKGLRHWAIVLDASEAEIEVWREHNVDVFNLTLDEFARGLDEALKASIANPPA